MSSDSSSADHSVTRLIAQLQEEDPQAAGQIWRRYFERLLPLARARLRSISPSAVDEEDILVSVFDRFFRAVKEERFTRLQDRNDLWQILLMLTERRVIDEYRRGAALKRGGTLTQELVGENTNAVDQVSDSEPGPEFAAVFNDNLSRALRRISEAKTREVALLRMEGYENKEIATKLGISLTSVERKLRVVRQLWEKEFAP